MSIKIVGIAGGSGSGKTTLCKAVATYLGERCLVVSSDHYYRSNEDLPEADRAELNFDHPDSLELDLLADHVQHLGGGHDIEMPTYCFETHTRLADTQLVRPKPLILVEGVLIFGNERLRDAMDLRIFVDADKDLRLWRRIKRDGIERARSEKSVRAQWADSVAPMYDQFVEPTREHVDLTVSTTYPSMDAEGELKEAVSTLSRTR